MRGGHTMNATGLFGGVRGNFLFVFARDPNDDDRLVRDRERGFKTGLLRRRSVSEQTHEHIARRYGRQPCHERI
jgi:hypothetical protein